MALVGDFSKLDLLRRRVESVTRAGMVNDLAAVLGVTAMKQVADSFRESRDPYGHAWAPLKYRKGKPLLDTGRMAASVNSHVVDKGVRISIPVKQAAIHQNGGQVAPHSRIRGRTLWRNPKTGRLVARNTKLRLVHESQAKAATFGNGITIPRRQMLPERDTGALGPIWARALNRATATFIRKRLSASAGDAE
jgi:phage gpG-like protein